MFPEPPDEVFQEECPLGEEWLEVWGAQTWQKGLELVCWEGGRWVEVWIRQCERSGCPRRSGKMHVGRRSHML